MAGGWVVFMYHLSFEVKLIPKFVFERPGVSVNFLPFPISWLCTKSFQGALPTWGRKWESQGKWRVLTLEQIGAGLTLTKAGGRLDVWGVKLELFGGVKALVTWFLSEAQKVSKTLILLRIECVGNRLFLKKNWNHFEGDEGIPAKPDLQAGRPHKLIMLCRWRQRKICCLLCWLYFWFLTACKFCLQMSGKCIRIICFIVEVIKCCPV